MLRLGSERPELRVVSDQFGCPTYTTDLARATLAVAGQLPDRRAGDEGFGLFHASGAGDTSWAGFAQAIFGIMATKGSRGPNIIPIATMDYPTPARRPANSRLDCGKLHRVFGIRQPPWFDGLSRCLDRLKHHPAN